MDQHPIENLMKTTLENIKDMIDVNTIIGDAVHTPDGTTIIPISRVGFGFGTGGSDLPVNSSSSSSSSSTLFGGGAGAGISIKPVAFLVVREDTIRLLPVDHHNSYEKIIDSFPQLVEVVKDVFTKGDQSNQDFSGSDSSNSSSSDQSSNSSNSSSN